MEAWRMGEITTLLHTIIQLLSQILDEMRKRN